MHYMKFYYLIGHLRDNIFHDGGFHYVAVRKPTQILSRMRCERLPVCVHLYMNTFIM